MRKYNSYSKIGTPKKEMSDVIKSNCVNVSA